MNTQNQQKFFYFIENLRGLSTLIVIYTHLCAWWSSANHKVSYLKNFVDKIFCIPLHLSGDLGYFAVLIFFLISGFIITHTMQNENRHTFFRKRFFRIVPTLFISLLIMYIINKLSSYFLYPVSLGNVSSNSIKDYLLTFFLVDRLVGSPELLVVTWTLLVEVIFYILCFIFLPINKNSPNKATFCIILSVCCITTLSPHNSFTNALAYYANYVLFVLLGRVIYLAIHNIVSHKQALIQGAVISFLFINYHEYIYPGRIFTSPDYFIYSLIFAFVIFLLFCLYSNKRFKFLKLVAKHSYTLYLIHIPVGSLILYLLNLLPISFDVCFILTTIVCLITATVLDLFFLQLPQKNLTKSR